MKHVRKNRWVWLLVFAISLLPIIDLLHSGLPVTHDGQDHVARIANFYQSLSEGNIVPRWAANLNWGYGHPIIMFLYPLPSYIAALVHLAGFSFVDSTKIVFALGFSASVLAMTVWALEAWGVWPGITAGVLYGFAPYRFVDLYVRGDIGEHLAFIFLPVILWGLLRLSRRETSRVGFILLSLGTAALILAHNALSLMFLPVAAVYGLYLGLAESKNKLEFVCVSLAAVVTGFALSAFFWIPAFFEGKYTLRDIVTAGQFDGRFVPWFRLIYSPWSYGGSDMLSKSLGWAQLVVIVLSVFALTRRSKQTVLISGTFALFIASVFIMTQGSSFVWTHITLLQKFQFPWRFLAVSVVATAILGALVTAVVWKKQKWIAIVICVLAVVGTFHMWHAKEYKVYPESFFTGVYHGTTDTGESSPIWSVRFMEHEASASMSLISGSAMITAGPRTTTSHVYEVTAKTTSRLVENTLYFPGWSVLVDHTPVTLQFQDPQYRGLMTFTVPTGTHMVDVIFADTKLRKLSNAISLASLVIFSLILGTMPLWRRKK